MKSVRQVLGMRYAWDSVRVRFGLALLAAAVITAGSFSVPAACAQELEDPLEGYNRAIFSFNEFVDDYFFHPVATGYDFVVPNPVQDGVDNFFVNLRTPIYLVSDLLQLKFKQFGTHTARFVINSTVGIAGLIDVAERIDLPHQPADFGIALGYNGVSPGPYFVIPFLGPSTIRDACGRVVDAFLNPTFYISELNISGRDAFYLSTGLYLLDSVNTRASLLDAVDTAKEASVDYYGFVRAAYGQLRERQIKGLPQSSADEYNFDDDEPAAGAQIDEAGRAEESGK